MFEKRIDQEKCQEFVEALQKFELPDCYLKNFGKIGVLFYCLCKNNLIEFCPSEFSRVQIKFVMVDDFRFCKETEEIDIINSLKMEREDIFQKIVEANPLIFSQNDFKIGKKILTDKTNSWKNKPFFDFVSRFENELDYIAKFSSSEQNYENGCFQSTKSINTKITRSAILRFGKYIVGFCTIKFSSGKLKVKDLCINGYKFKYDFVFGLIGNHKILLEKKEVNELLIYSMKEENYQFNISIEDEEKFLKDEMEININGTIFGKLSIPS